MVSPRELWIEVERAGRTRLHWLLLALSPAGWVMLAVGRFLLVPDPSGHGTHVQLGLAPCLPMQRYGIPCPACGLTTAVTHFAHGELGASLVVQPLGFALGAVALALPAALVIAHVRGVDVGRALLDRRTPRLIAAAIGFAALCWVYKVVATR